MVTIGQPETLVTTSGEPAASDPTQIEYFPTGRRIILLTTPASYRGNSFLTAATALGLDVIHGIDMPSSLAEHWHMTLGLDFTNPYRAAEELAAFVATNPVDAIIAIDDSATLLAALASAAVGLPHNDPESALAARDKFVMRERLRTGGVRVPEFKRYLLSRDPDAIASEVTFPVVVKPLQLSGSRGVIRADNREEFVAAFERTKRLLVGDGHLAEETSVLVEQYLPGDEVALEGLLNARATTGSRPFRQTRSIDWPIL